MRILLILNPGFQVIHVLTFSVQKNLIGLMLNEKLTGLKKKGGLDHFRSSSLNSPQIIFIVENLFLYLKCYISFSAVLKPFTP